MGASHHDHTHPGGSFGKAFTIGILLNTVYVAVEAFYGFTINSSALLADAGHNLSDVLSLGLAWAAMWVAQRKPSGRYTYGLRKTTILASLVNGILILVASGLILWDAINKIQEPVAVPGQTLMIVASIGVVVNVGTALMFIKGSKEDLNIRGAFLHMTADAAVTIGVFIGGFIISRTGAYWIDPAFSFVIVGVIVYSAWGLLSDSARLALDGVPKNVDIQRVQRFLEEIDGVEEVHDLHVWALSTTENALTAHLVVPGGHNDQFIFDVQQKISREFKIDHSTLQVENTFDDPVYRS